MSNLEELGLLSKGMDCLTIFNNIFLNALQQKNFDSARDCLHKYTGALVALSEVDIIPQREALSMMVEAIQRYRKAKYPGASGEDA